MENEKVREYLKTLTDIEKQTMEIAKTNLKTSFDIERSLGFIEWLKNNK